MRALGAESLASEWLERIEGGGGGVGGSAGAKRLTSQLATTMRRRQHEHHPAKGLLRLACATLARRHTYRAGVRRRQWLLQQAAHFFISALARR